MGAARRRLVLQAPTLRVRVPIGIEEAPAFLLGGRGQRMDLDAYELRSPTRTWLVTGTGRFGLAGPLAQRVWLALCRLYDEQRAPDGTVRYSLPQLAELVGSSARSGKAQDDLRLAMRQLENLSVYTSAPLWEHDPALTAGRRRSRQGMWWYRFLGDEGFEELPEDRSGRQLMLVLPRSTRGPLRSRTRLSRYVVDALQGQGGRVVPDWAMQLRNAYAVRLTRLIGKRANRRASLTLSWSALLPMLPALGVEGQLLAPHRARASLERAYSELQRAGFLDDVIERDDMLVFRLGSEAGVARQLSADDSACIEEVVALLGPGAEASRDFYATCLHDGVSAAWLRGNARELAGEDGIVDRAAVLGRRLTMLRDDLGAGS